MEDELPDQLFHRKGDDIVSTYDVGELIGKGGFSKVYKLTKQPSGEAFAAKICTIESRKNLEREAVIHRELSHPHILQLVEVFEDQEFYIMVLEYCEHGSIQEFIKTRKKITEPEARKWLLQCVEGLQYLHANNVIHRDVKPGNIFLDSEYRCKIGDFGLAFRIESSQPSPSKVVGTPNYVAPEVIWPAKGCCYGFGVDIWSLGVTLYYWLVGKAPFETSSIRTTYRRIRDAIFYFPDRANLSKESRDLIKQMLKKKPSDRLSLEQIKTSQFMKMTSTQQTSSKPSKPSKPKKLLKRSIVDEAHEALTSYFSCNLLSSKKPPSPSVWVSRWSSAHKEKYGLSYRLNTTAIGVKFNDGTTLIGTSDGDSMDYIDKKWHRSCYQSGEYPRELTKKVRLLAYLALTDESDETVSMPVDQMLAVYVKKWVQTMHALFFRLSNKSLQVEFNDKTSIILTEHGKVVSFTLPSEKQCEQVEQERQTLWLSLVREHAMAKRINSRLKYIRDILGTMIDARPSRKR